MTHVDHPMSFMEHLEELRNRIIKAGIGLLVTIGICYFFSEFLFHLLLQPLFEAWAAADLGVPQIHFANPIEPFLVYLKTALIGGLLCGSPIVFYQLWQFVAPGLYQKERRYVLPFTLASTVFFIGGACFGYFVVFPLGFRFFLGFARTSPSALENFSGLFRASVGKPFTIQPTLMMNEYFGLVWRMLLAFGLVFELPVFLFFLALIGLITPRKLWQWNPYFIVVATVLGGMLTPPDIISQLLMAVPLIALYNFSILLTYIAQRRRST